MSNRPVTVSFWVPLLFGLLALANVAGNPRVATLHGSDIVQLIAVGLCLGVALGTRVGSLHAAHSHPPATARRPSGDYREQR